MWKDYVSGSVKNNRSFGLSVRLSALISALLLSLLCGLFYNTWKYEVERIVLEQGGWHSRVTGDFARQDDIEDDKKIKAIKDFPSVKDAAVSEKGQKGTETTVDLYFENMASVFSDTPRIAALVGVSPEKTEYHYELLAMYLVRDASDTAPRLLFPMFILITLLASLSLIVLIHNAFAVSMNARIHQFGIFSSIGATPKQVRACLLQEAAALCAVPVFAGNLLGIAGSLGLSWLSNKVLGSNIPGRHEAVPGYHPLVLVLTLSVTVLTIWASAWLPARKLSRMTPLAAIKNTGELQLKRRKKRCLLSPLFGVEGELAVNALKAQRKALRTASWSFVCAFLAFTVMQCFFALSGISTRETYFERYQGVWDIMVTVRDTEVDAFDEATAVQELAGVKSAIVYQKAAAKRIVTEEETSAQMQSFGGFLDAPKKYVSKVDGGWLVNAPIIILDDDSFLAYCEQIGAAPQLGGAVILNQIRDVTNPDFRHPDFMPYIKVPDTREDAVTVLRQPGKEDITAEVPVLSYTQEAPALREEYATLDYYELVHFMPASLWKVIKGRIGEAQEDSFICVRAEHAAMEELTMLQDEAGRLLSGNYTIECENRIQKYETNNKQIQGIKAVYGGFCALLAVIGIGNVFSNTLGFVRQRKREFARYLSVGMTPEGIRKIFCIEALVLAGRPILLSLPLAVAAVWYMLRMSYVEAGEFLAETPFVPIVLFMLAILGSVALAYAAAWRNVRKISLAEVLKDDTMM
ncbi:MAG: ABC transporter permease [Eubacterium sp.]|nr:ABC transporter permease [Eubacterium sp.]